MSKIFILLNQETGDVRKYLNVLRNVDLIVDNENHENYFDEKLFEQILSNLPDDGGYPNFKTYRVLFSEYTDYHFLEGAEEIKVGQQSFKEDILGVCFNNPRELVINHGRFVNDIIKLNKMNSGRYEGSVELKLLNCDEKSIYEWFAENREEKREFDENYLKHSRFKARKDEKGNTVSPLRIEEGVLSDALKKAVGTKDERRIYFFDKETNLFLVFYHQNMGSLYHGHEILREDKKKEEQKINNRVIDKMKKLFDYKLG